MDIAYQLYCSRNFLPLPDTLRMLAAAGYSSVEAYGGLLGDIDGLARALNSAGLTMDSTHMGLDMVEGDPDRAVQVAKTLGAAMVFVPYLDAKDRPADAVGWRAFAQRVADAGAPLRAAGIAFGWHNHDFELEDLPGGGCALDIFAETPGLSLELDIGWVARAGHDPVQVIAKHADKIIAAHIKDLAPAGENADEDGWSDVGHGTLDWPAIHAALKSAGVGRYVIEHDNPSDDARFAQRSLATVRTF